MQRTACNVPCDLELLLYSLVNKMYYVLRGTGIIDYKSNTIICDVHPYVRVNHMYNLASRKHLWVWCINSNAYLTTNSTNSNDRLPTQMYIATRTSLPQTNIHVTGFMCVLCYHNCFILEHRTGRTTCSSFLTTIIQCSVCIARACNIGCVVTDNKLFTVNKNQPVIFHGCRLVRVIAIYKYS